MEVTSAGSCTSSNAHKDQHAVPAKRKFFQWAVKWFYANMSEDHQEKPDAPVLACILQAIGFQLREFEKIEDADGSKKEPRNEGLTVTIECATSGMRARLEMDGVKCRCPNSEDAKEASFWSVSGTGPAESTNKVEESGSNLLPPVSKETGRVVNEVMYRLLAMIGDKSLDVNQNDGSHSNLNVSRVSSTRDVDDVAINESLTNDSVNIVRSRTQPEIVVSGGKNALHRMQLARFNWLGSLAKENSADASKNWIDKMDVECGSIDGDQPRPSPPKIASSPAVLHQLCSSLGQISLQSEEETGNLTEHVIRAHRSLEKAVEILLARRSPLSRHSPNLDEGTFLKPSPGGSHPTGSAAARKNKSTSSGSLRVSPSNSASSRPGSSCSTPATMTTLSSSARILSTSASGRQSLALPAKSTARRSVGSTLARMSTTPLSSATGARRHEGQSSGLTAAAGVSKIPPRRKSFGALAGQTLKLSVPKDRSSAGGTRKNATSPTSIPPEERVMIVAKRRVSPDPKSIVGVGGSATSGIQRPGLSQNSGGPKPGTTEAVPGVKASAQAKSSTATTKEPSAARKPRENQKFGFCNKKS